MYGTVPSGPPDCKRGIEMMKPLLSSSFKKEPNIQEYIIYEDSHILLCHKPAGMAVQTRQTSQTDLEHIIKNYLAKNMSQKDSTPYLAVINRLDQPVEGLILFAKTKEAAASLSRQLTGHTLTKEYLAITSSIPQKESAILKDYLKKDSKQNKSSVVSNNTPDGKPASLSYVLEETNGTYGLLHIELHTGRHHQIRAQLSHINAPLLGDEKYGGVPEEYLCLCSLKLAFVHPSTEEEVSFVTTPRNPLFKKLFPDVL